MTTPFHKERLTFPQGTRQPGPMLSGNTSIHEVIQTGSHQRHTMFGTSGYDRLRIFPTFPRALMPHEAGERMASSNTRLEPNAPQLLAQRFNLLFGVWIWRHLAQPNIDGLTIFGRRR